MKAKSIVPLVGVGKKIDAKTCTIVESFLVGSQSCDGGTKMMIHILKYFVLEEDKGTGAKACINHLCQSFQ